MEPVGNDESTEEQQPGLIFDGGKKGSIFVIDYGHHMFEEDGWRFRLALEAVRQEINILCCSGDLNEFGAVLFANTAISNEKAENITYIFVHRELGTMDAEYVKELDTILQKKNLKEHLDKTLVDSGNCSWAELFFLCHKLFVNAKTVLRKKVINVFTADSEPILPDVQKATLSRIEEFQRKNIETKIHLFEKDDKHESDTIQFWESVDPEFERYSSHDDLTQSSHFKNYALRSTASLPFVLADGIQFAVGLYYLVKPLGKPGAILMDAETNERIEQRTHYIPKQSNFDGTDAMDAGVLPGTVQGECFEGDVNFKRDIGGVGVELTREDLEKLRRFDKPGITVIGFKPLKLLKDSHRMSEAKFIYPLDAVIVGSSNVYRALFKCCLDKQLFILVRYTQKTNTPPQICALVPQSSGEDQQGSNLPKEFFYEGFHLLELPFAEEARNLREFDRYKTQEDIGAWPSPNEEQIRAAKEFTAKLTKKFSPDQFPNPMLQRHYKAVETVALDLNLDSFVKHADEANTLKPYFEKKENVDRVVAQINKLKELCKADNEDPDEKPKRGGKQKVKEEENEETMNSSSRSAPKRGRKATTK